MTFNYEKSNQKRLIFFSREVIMAKVERKGCKVE